jgi:hypothetical protein
MVAAATCLLCACSGEKPNYRSFKMVGPASPDTIPIKFEFVIGPKEIHINATPMEGGKKQQLVYFIDDSSKQGSDAIYKVHTQRGEQDNGQLIFSPQKGIIEFVPSNNTGKAVFVID